MMKTLALLILYALFASTPLYAQEPLQLHYDCRSEPAGFAQVRVIDRRMPGQLLGYVQKGVFNELTQIRFEGSLADSLTLFFRKAAPAPSAGNERELVLVLEDFFLSEHTGAMSEEGSFKLSTRLFAGAGAGQYNELMTIDTTYKCSGFDVTHKLLRSVSDHLCDIAAAARATAGRKDNAYSWSELQQLDSIEAQRIPVFTGKPAAGIYKNFRSFLANTPDYPVEISITEGSQGRVGVYQIEHKRNGKEKKINLTQETRIYAVSDGERIVKYFEGSCYELHKSGTGFYFDGKTAYSANTAAMMGGAIGGLAGMAIAAAASGDHRKLYRFRINLRTGKSTPMMALEQ